MRAIAKFLVILLLSVTVITVYETFNQKLEKDTAVNISRADNVTHSTSYLLNGEYQTRLLLQPEEPTIKILSNLSLANNSLNSEASYPYGIEYTLLDKNNQILDQGKIHHVATPIQYSGSSLATKNRIYDIDRANDVLPTRVSYIHIKNLNEARNIRFAFNPETKDQSLYIRAYQKAVYNEEKTNQLWARLPHESKVELASASVFDLSNIRRKDKRSLLNSRWLRLSPIGTENTDYISTTLRQIDLDPKQILPTQGSYSTRIADYNYPVAINIPVEGEVKLNISSLDGSKFTAIDLHWFGIPASRQFQKLISTNSSNLQYAQHFDKGKLYIASDRPVQISAKLKSLDGLLDISPYKKSIKVYSLDSTGKVVYRPTLQSHIKSTFKITAWSASVSSGEIIVSSYNKQKELLKQFNIDLSSSFSLYEKAVTQNGYSQVKQPVVRYFELDRNTEELIISSSDNVYIRVQASSPAIHKMRHINKTSTSDQSKQNLWFTLKATTNSHKTSNAFIDTQDYPPIVDANILSGNFEWTLILPTGQWNGQQFLTPIDSHQSFRQEALPSLYSKFSYAENGTFNHSDITIAYKRGSSNPSALTIIDSAERVVTLNLSLHAGLIKLSDLGIKNIKNLSSRNADVLINYATSADYILKSAVDVSNRELTYLLEKASTRAMFSIYHIQEIKEGDSSIGLTITLDLPDERASLSNDYTYKNTSYRIEQDNTSYSLIMNTGEPASFDRGHRLFIVLGDDIPNGTYKATIKSSGNKKSYISLSQTTPTRLNKVSIGDHRL